MDGRLKSRHPASGFPTEQSEEERERREAGKGGSGTLGNQDIPTSGTHPLRGSREQGTEVQSCDPSTLGRRRQGDCRS